ncbi:MAG: Fe-S cluster assembly protein SufD [Actinomycetota bacterium]
MVNGFGADAAKRLSDHAGEPGWLTERRLAAFQRFESLPWPDPAQEAWRYSNLEEFDLGSVLPGLGDHPAVDSLTGVRADVHAQMSILGERSGHAVQVDAHVVLATLDEPVAAKGVVYSTLAKAANDHPDLVRDALGSAGVTQSDEKFQALAHAFAGEGLFVYVPRGVEVPLPLHSFRYVSAAGRASFARTLVVVEEGAAVTLIEHLRSPHLGGAALSVGTTEILAGQASNVQALAVQDFDPAMWHFATQRTLVGRDATVRSLAATLGGRFSRSVVESILQGAGGYSEMLGVYFGDSVQHFDHRSLQEHVAPNAKSELYYKGALKDRSTAVYSGLIHIAKDAQGTDSWQGNRNLILSDRAKADSIPYLEIEANDVRCAHGASVGPPDEDVLFYLRSRGLDPRAAERLVVKGFFQEVLDRVRVTEVREALEAAVEAELIAMEGRE